MTALAARFVKLVIVIVTFTAFLSSPSLINAQELSGGQIATNVEVSDAAASAGDLLSITVDNTLVRSSSAYDQNLFGVVVKDPSIVLNKETTSTKPVLSEGEAQVKVSTANGNIEVGDLITSSSESGVGQKAVKEGMVIGKALASFSESSPGTIPVLLNIHHQSQLASGGDLGELWDRVFALTAAGLQESDSFQLLLRYLFALIIGIMSFSFGFYFAARSIRTGLVALGRNPLAKDTIQAGMFFNLFTVILLSMAGVGLAMFVIFYR